MVAKEYKKYINLALWIGVFLLASTTIGMLNKGNTSSVWYATLKQSPLRPPRWVFGIVWPVLYTMIAISGWTIWRTQSIPYLTTIKALFFGQTLLNWIWMPLFFAYRSTGWALICLIMIVFLVGMLIIKTYSTLKRVSYLLMPYFLWLVFATHLNLYIWQHN
jgi:benzodiazapine receptor